MAEKRDRIVEELTHAELEAEVAELLPERAAMSTLSVTGLDAASGTVEAVGDGVSETAAAAGETSTSTLEAAGTTAEPAAAAESATASAPEPFAAAEPTATAESRTTAAERPLSEAFAERGAPSVSGHARDTREPAAPTQEGRGRRVPLRT